MATAWTPGAVGRGDEGIGSGSEYDENALGKYGYGLKGASWSQAKVFTVVTKCASKPAHHLTWDASDMVGWVAKSDPLERWEQNATGIKGHGTVVLWKNMRPPQSMPTAHGLDPRTQPGNYAAFGATLRRWCSIASWRAKQQGENRWSSRLMGSLSSRTTL